MATRSQFTRRHFLSTSAATLMAAHSGLLADGQVALAAKPFDARNAMRFANMPDTSDVGLPKATVIYASRLWPKNASKAEPDVRFLAEHLLPAIRHSTPDILIIDIEHWHLSEGSQRDIDSNIDRYVTVIEAFRDYLPNTRLGFYGMMPVRNYWSPVNGQTSRLTEWRDTNRRLQRLGDAVDITFPSLYTFYNDPAGWEIYARANISEAQKYGKPVYCFLWPQLHDTRQPISAKFWRQQLQTVYEQADGMVIWSPARGNPRWDATAPWWLATLAFLETTDGAK